MVADTLLALCTDPGLTFGAGPWYVRTAHQRQATRLETMRGHHTLLALPEMLIEIAAIAVVP